MKLSPRFGGLIASAVILAASNTTCAQRIPGYPDSIDAHDEREMALLPPYCVNTLSYRQHIKRGNDQAAVARWYQLMGPTFLHMHHYCNALMDTNRALLLAPNQGVRNFYLRASIIELDYVLERATPDFVMLPEILTKKGENLLRLNELGVGLAQLEQAIQLKPDYWPPYVVASDYYKKQGNVAKAREWLERATKYSPDSQAVKTRIAELDSTARKSAKSK